MIKKINKTVLIYIALIVVLTIIFLLIKNSTLYIKILNADYTIFTRFINNPNLRAISLFKFLTFFGDFYIPIIIIVCSFLFIKNKLYFCSLAASYTISGAISFLLKIVIARPRPVFALIEMPKSYSFPSGHTLTSIVFFFTLWYLITHNKPSIVKVIYFGMFTILIWFIGISRVYLCVHFTSDVIGGLILGIICAIMNIVLIKKVFGDKL